MEIWKIGLIMLIVHYIIVIINYIKVKKQRDEAIKIAERLKTSCETAIENNMKTFKLCVEMKGIIKNHEETNLKLKQIIDEQNTEKRI